MRFPFILDECTFEAKPILMRYFRGICNDEKISFADILRAMACVTKEIVAGSEAMDPGFINLIRAKISDHRSKIPSA